jgi:hypothetical protein
VVHNNILPQLPKTQGAFIESLLLSEPVSHQAICVAQYQKYAGLLNQFFQLSHQPTQPLSAVEGDQ